jgi:GNAT superfamily N-acetyltransferase
MLCRMSTVRLATPADAASVSALVIGLADGSLVDPKGEEAQRFRASMSPEEVARYLDFQNRFYAVAQVDGEVRGMIMVRDDNYIGQFFVSQVHQGQGIGSALWQFALAHALQRGGSGHFTVNSSLVAVPVYNRFGFTATGAIEEAHGFRFVPMRRMIELPGSPPIADPAAAPSFR